MLDLLFRSRFSGAFYMFGSVWFWFGKQIFDWLVLFGSGRTVKHCFGRSLLWIHVGIAGIVNYMICSLVCLKFIAASLLKLRRMKTKSYKNWTFQADINCIPTEILTMIEDTLLPLNELKWTRNEILNLFPFVFYIVLNIMI